MKTAILLVWKDRLQLSQLVTLFQVLIIVITYENVVLFLKLQLIAFKFSRLFAIDVHRGLECWDRV